LLHEGQSLEELLHRLRKIDRHVLALISQRVLLARRIAKTQTQTGGATRADVFGADVPQHIVMWAKDHGMAPELAIGLMKQLNDAALSPAEPARERHRGAEAQDPATLRANLLALTARIARDYDTKYDKQFFATGLQRLFESIFYERTIADVEDRELALDLGCATGSYARRMSFTFRKVIGFDISPVMVDYAKRSPRPSNPEVLDYREADLECGIPVGDASASMIVMSFGTASETGDLHRLLREIERVLKPGGKALLSFYNRDALAYRFESLPWPLSLAAEMDPRQGCVDVHVGEEVFRIQARAYSIGEVQSGLPPGLRLVLHHTFPTMSAILPNEFFEDEEEIRGTIEDIDDSLKQGSYGYYLITVIEKKPTTEGEESNVLSA
jgi:SAM-dependent methyltransferase/chorismate mutase